MAPERASPFPSRWEASAKAIRNVDFSPAHSDGVLFSCDESGACKLWSVDRGEEIAQLTAPPGLPRGTRGRRCGAGRRAGSRACAHRRRCMAQGGRGVTVGCTDRLAER